MKSFKDRIDRTEQGSTTDEGRQIYERHSDDAFLLQRDGRIDDACAIYMDVHQRVMSSWHEGNDDGHKQATTNDDVDLSASDVGQMLEICCKNFFFFFFTIYSLGFLFLSSFCPILLNFDTSSISSTFG
jgi:hypothetical protein